MPPVALTLFPRRGLVDRYWMVGDSEITIQRHRQALINLKRANCILITMIIMQRSSRLTVFVPLSRNSLP